MFSSIPFIKLTIAFALGIILSTFFGLQIQLLTIIISFIVLLIFHFITHNNSRFISYFGLVFLSFIMILGIFKTVLSKNRAEQVIQNENKFVIGQITKTPKIYENFVKTNLEIIAIKGEKELEESQGKSLLMLEKDSLSIELKKGDYIQFQPVFKEIEANKNPEVFNYKRYLFFHLISQQTFLKSKNWNIIKIKKSWFDLNQISDLRRFLLQKYKDYGIKNNELSVLSALTLGYKNKLDYNIQKSYAASGAIHVLAVSGLHVGIIFMVISQILKFLGKTKPAKTTRFILTFLSIWFFALLTGAAPSVLRASLMFSFIALGQSMNKKGSIYNSIFASAFILLFINPFLLFDLSFQLSYSAVISIVYFQPIIFQLIPTNNLISKWVWGLSSVSIAAQIGTFPITIFYFHQFPNYFLISNFIVIPLATVIIWLSILFFASLSIPVIAKFFALILSYIIHFQNLIIAKIESWPHSLSENLFINSIQLGLLILIILALMLLIYKRRFIHSTILALLILSFTIYSDTLFVRNQNQKEIIIYDIKGFTAINLIDGKDNILISSLKNNAKQKDFNIKQNWLSLGLDNEKFIETKQLNNKHNLSLFLKTQNPNFFIKNQFFQFFDKRILFIQDKSILSKFKATNLPIDYLIIGNNTQIDLAELDLYFSAQTIIIDSSHSTKSLQFWKTQQAINPSKNIYLVSEKGAFVHELDI